MVDTNLVPIAFVFVFAFALVSVTKIISDGVTRRRLINAGTSPEMARAIAAATRDDPGLYSALRWGIVTGTAGLALILIQFLPYRPDQPIVMGVVLVFVAAGLLGYYAGARRLLRTTGKSEVA